MPEAPVWLDSIGKTLQQTHVGALLLLLLQAC